MAWGESHNEVKVEKGEDITTYLGQPQLLNHTVWCTITIIDGQVNKCTLKDKKILPMQTSDYILVEEL